MKSETVKIRLSADEKAAFQRAAEISGISLSSWMRERLRLAATRDLEQTGKTPEFLAKLQG
jgi:uncharacterized protein (DUF1778 family)